jgi:hypothetical protein
MEVAEEPLQSGHFSKVRGNYCIVGLMSTASTMRKTPSTYINSSRFLVLGCSTSSVDVVKYEMCLNLSHNDPQQA